MGLRVETSALKSCRSLSLAVSSWQDSATGWWIPKTGKLKLTAYLFLRANTTLAIGCFSYVQACHQKSDLIGCATLRNAFLYEINGGWCQMSNVFTEALSAGFAEVWIIAVELFFLLLPNSGRCATSRLARLSGCGQGTHTQTRWFHKEFMDSERPKADLNSHTNRQMPVSTEQSCNITDTFLVQRFAPRPLIHTNPCLLCRHKVYVLKFCTECTFCSFSRLWTCLWFLVPFHFLNKVFCT